MKSSQQIWKERLAGKMPPDWAREIDIFETEVLLKKQKKMEDKVFGETRLRRGVYGQRYDNGSRSDGTADRTIPYPCGDLSKGPDTKWDAPGMQRIKIPWGGMTPEQMDVLAELAEEYSDSICHVTTRQDIQLHFVHLEDTPTLFRRLAAVGITTREACGNSVRNVTACPLAGVCPNETFDVTPYAEATFRYLLGHPDVQDFGRKFKPAFSGCADKPCGLVKMHDIGFVAKTKLVDGKVKRGFEMVVGGGLGAVPYQAKVFDEFVPEEEFLALTQAVCRIFTRHGEKKNRNRARIKFLVHGWGIEKFRQMVLEERAKLPTDPRWTEFLSDLDHLSEKPLRPADPKVTFPTDRDFEEWLKTNAVEQKQAAYHMVTIALPLGDITSNQMRDLAGIVRKYLTGQKGMARTTVEQNIVLRWIPKGDLHPLYQDLKKIDLALPGAGTIVDVTACPGTDTCRLGISSSRGLAGVLREHLAQKSYEMDQAVTNLRIKVSGCFNSCGQHHIADMGFYGISRKVGNYIVPHFQLLLGGQSRDNAGSYGMAAVAVPSKAVPRVVDRLTELYVRGRSNGEKFQDFFRRLGKVDLKKSIGDLLEVPPYESDPSYYVDWADVRTYTISDLGKGECAGEIVSLTDFGLKAADREMFEATVAFDGKDFRKASRLAYQAMLQAAQGLIKATNPDISEKPDAIVKEFDDRFCQTQLFYDKYAGAKFAQFLFSAHEAEVEKFDEDKSRKLLEEAQLFIDAAYACNVKMGKMKATVSMETGAAEG